MTNRRFSDEQELRVLTYMMTMRFRKEQGNPMTRVEADELWLELGGSIDQ